MKHDDRKSQNMDENRIEENGREGVLGKNSYIIGEDGKCSFRAFGPVERKARRRRDGEKK